MRFSSILLSSLRPQSFAARSLHSLHWRLIHGAADIDTSRFDSRGTFCPPQVSSSTPTQMAGGLRLINSDDQEFEDHVSGTYPLIANSELYPQARKFMAVLRHDGSADAKAYRVLWTIQESPTQQRFLTALYIRKHCMLRRAVLNIKPGSKRLVSMFFNYSTSDYAFRPEHAGLRIPPSFPFMDRDVISVGIDAVIYSNGTIAGPDAFDLRSRYLATGAAEHNEGYSLYWKMEKMRAGLGPGESLDPGQIATILEGDFQYGAVAQGGDPKAIHRRARGQEAALMKGILSSRGLGALEANVAHRVKFYRHENLKAAV